MNSLVASVCQAMLAGECRLAFLRGGELQQYQALLRILELELGDEQERLDRIERDLLISVAFKLVPIQAVNYSATDERTRHSYIREHLIESHGLEPGCADSLSRALARFVCSLLESRSSALTRHQSFLLERQGRRCASCGVILHPVPEPVNTRDPFKPFFRAGEEDWIGPEVDHKNPVSLAGSNRLDNLQVLCRLCNQGKGAGAGVNPFKEIEFCAREVGAIPRGHLSRLLYSTLSASGFRCSVSGKGPGEAELTLRKDKSNGLVVRANLRVVEASPT